MGVSPFQHMQRFVDRFSKAELEDFLHLPVDVAAGADVPAPTLLSLAPADVRPGPLSASTRSYVMERIEERLFGVCEGLLRQLEGDAAAGQEKTLKERYMSRKCSSINRVTVLCNNIFAISLGLIGLELVSMFGDFVD